MRGTEWLASAVAVAGVLGGILCLLAMTTYDWRAARHASGFRWMPAWRVRHLSPRGRRWMAWGFVLALPWWTWSACRLLFS